ncbi:unnamed protein product, partial [Citrullus colocynthis]
KNNQNPWLTLTSVDGNRSEPAESGPVIFSIKVATVRYSGEAGFRMKTERAGETK